jgi:uncharacterized membrane protein
MKARLRPGQWAFGLLFWWMSLYPTLLPRDEFSQGAISGISTTMGMAVGALLAWLMQVLFGVLKRPVPQMSRGWGPRLLGLGTFLGVFLGLAWWMARQNGQRGLVGMEPLAAGSILAVVFWTLLIGAVLFVIGRSIARAVRRAGRQVAQVVPRPVAVLITILLVASITLVLSRDVVAKQFVNWANSTYGTFDDTTPPGIEQPTTALRSGGPGSLVAWNTLGYEGRNFAGGGPTLEELQQFAGPTATVMEPIRAYVGLQSADSPEAQADLAVQELERTGAFTRSVLAIDTVTGTGWVDPLFAAGLEYMNNGDTAIVATQYSYLPSWISFLVDLDKAKANGQALVSAVTARWSQLPIDSRPRLVAFGESLGSYGSEQAFARGNAQESVDATTASVDAALWMGPTFANPIWRQVVDARDPGAPAWRPEYGSGNQVTIMGWPDQEPVAGVIAPGHHIVYMTHPSDPVTWARVDALWKKPEWMNHPVGYDVPNDAVWFPGVTFVQTVFDLMAGFSAPPGHGHNYNPNMANGVAAIAAPSGWSAADTVRLDKILNADLP